MLHKISQLIKILCIITVSGCISSSEQNIIGIWNTYQIRIAVFGSISNYEDFPVIDSRLFEIDADYITIYQYHKAYNDTAGNRIDPLVDCYKSKYVKSQNKIITEKPTLNKKTIIDNGYIIEYYINEDRPLFWSRTHNDKFPPAHWPWPPSEVKNIDTSKWKWNNGCYE